MQTLVPPISLADQNDDAADSSNAKALTALYDRSMDSVKGYAKMVEKADPSFRDTAERFRALHSRHADELALLLSGLRVGTDGDGSLMGTVNQAVITFRAFFDDIDEDVMDQVRSGEDWVLKSFDEAIVEQSGTDAAAKLQEMQGELTDLLAETRHLG